jgi:hypothetical protein
MSRPFDFGTLTRQRTRIRQFGMCAVCGDRLDDLVEHAHHVIPNQSGNPADADHQALRTVENCVVICDACHERVHENGRYRTGR